MKNLKKTLRILIIITFFANYSFAQIDESIKTTAESYTDNYSDVYMETILADYPDATNLIKNVSIPGLLGGVIPTDIIFLESYNKFYVYGKRRLIVIDALNNSVTNSIEISSNSQVEPVDRNGSNVSWHEEHMVFVDKPGQNDDFVYCVTEELKLIKINPNDDSFITVVNPPSNLPTDKYYSSLKLKYDERTNRIYWTVIMEERDFNSILIYNASTLSLIGNIDIDEGGRIEDMAINDTYDEIYVSYSHEIRVYSSNNYQLINTFGNNGEQKGDLLYIHHNNIHSLYCFPRTYLANPASIWQINFNNTPNTITSFTSPYPTETACYYNENNEEIYIGFDAPSNNVDNVYIIDPNNNNNVTFSLNANANSDYYLNTPISFKTFNNKVVLCNLDDIILIDYNNNYSLNFIKSAENNMFFKCAVSTTHALVTSPYGGDITVIDNNSQIDDELEVGAALYFGCFNPDKNKAYFYTKSRKGKSKVYIYHTDSANDDIVILEMGSNISDMFVYAPDEITNRVYVSNFDDTWIIKAIDGETDVIIDESTGHWIYTDQNYVTSMYLAPNNILYCMTGMDNLNGNRAGIELYDANNDFARLGFHHYYTDIIGALDGEFAYNSYDNKVYAIAWDMTPNPYGKFTVINETNTAATDFNIDNVPTQIVCSPYNAKVYVKHAGSNNALTVFGCKSFTFDEDILIGQPVRDIEYDPIRNLLFVLYTGESNYKLGFVDNTSFYSGMDLPTSSCKIAYNPGNTSIYAYIPHNSANDEDAEIWQCILDDYSSGYSSFTTIQTSLQNKHTYKFNGHLFNNDILFNEELQQLYVANGGHSNISVLSYESIEPLVLHEGYNWISVPKHVRTSGNSTPTSIVFHKDNVSPDYEMINIEYNFLNINMDPFEENPVNAIWDQDWIYTDNTMQNITSTRGYVVYSEPTNNRVLIMEGTVEDPASSIDLYCKKENWIGYFIPEEQSVFDALADIIDDVYHIQLENCNCWRHNYPISNSCGTKSTKDYSPGTWICDGRPNVNYAEMVKVSPLQDIFNFQWNYSGNPPSDEIRPEVEYYAYEKGADYETFVIVLDTTETIPTEIGAFVNDTCVGACTVLPNDTVVVLSAYLSDNPGDSVVFEQYYGSSKMSNLAVNNYYVKNSSQLFEKRVIYTGEKQEAFVISFKDGTVTIPTQKITDELHLYPNPAADNVVFNIILEHSSNTKLTVYDFQGRVVRVLLDEKLQEGNTQVICNLNNDKIPAGSYLVHLTTNNTNITKKLIVK